MVLAITSGLSFFDLGRRDRRERDLLAPSDRPLAARTAHPFERDSLGGAMQLAFLAVLCVAAAGRRPPEMAWHHSWPLSVLGFALVMAGVWMRRGAAHALGRHFTVGLSFLADHELVTSGPYRWIRHPNYAGLLLIALGTATMMSSASAVGVTLAVWLPLALMRIASEERVLHARLGTAFAEYAAGRWCLVPGVY